MPKTYEKLPAERIAVIADALSAAARHFVSVLQAMQSVEMKEIYIEWSTKHSMAEQLMAEAGLAAENMSVGQIIAHRAGVPSSYEVQAKRVARDTERRRERNAEKAKAKLKVVSPPEGAAKRKKATTKRPGRSP